MRPDSGCVYFAVSPAPPRDYYGEVASIAIPYVETEYFRLSRADDDFERGHSSLLLQLASAIKISCSPDLSPLAVTILDYDDLETERPLTEIDRDLD